MGRKVKISKIQDFSLDGLLKDVDLIKMNVLLQYFEFYAYIISVQDVWQHAAFTTMHIPRIVLKIKIHKLKSNKQWLPLTFLPVLTLP